MWYGGTEIRVASNLSVEAIAADRGRKNVFGGRVID
jgi:hypothetical protein